MRGSGIKHWLENSARFKPGEMAAGIEGICNNMLRFYTMAFIFTTNSAAQRMCDDGGIAARKTEAGTHALTLCLQSPAELGWQKNAGGWFRQNVAALMGMSTSDVQAMVIMGIPSRAIDEAGCKDKATFTIQERADEFKLLVPCSGNGAMYSAAHVVKMYELEPSTLVDMRKELVEFQASAGGRTISLEKRIEWDLDVQPGQDQTALERKIERLQAVEMAASTEVLADGVSERGATSVLSLEAAIEQAVAAERTRADRAEARADQEKARADQAEACVAVEKEQSAAERRTSEAIAHIDQAMRLLLESMEQEKNAG
jgi:hypothetical protein